MEALEIPTDPPLAPALEPPEPKKEKEGKDGKEAKPAREPVSATMRAIEREEEISIANWLATIGNEGAFRVQLARQKPQHLMVNGRSVDTSGYLDTYDHTIDEAFIQSQWGGGTYTLKVTRPGADGSFRYTKGLHRTVTIAGDPRVDRLPGNPAPTPAPAAAQGENPNIVKAAFDAMQRQLDRAATTTPDRGIDPAVQLLLDQMRADMAEMRRAISVRDAALAEARNQRPPEDPFRDKMLSNLMEGESARIASLNARHETEIRTIKEGARQDLERIQDRHDRALAEARQAGERALDLMRSGFEREIAALRQSHEVMLASTRTTSEVQVTTLRADNARLERQVDMLERQVKDLREKKEKGLLEQVAEVDKIREVLGGEEGGGKLDKLIEMVPTVMEGIGQMIGRGAPPPGSPGVPVAAGAAPAQPVRRIVQDRRTGQKFQAIQPATGGPAQLVPVKKKAKVIAKEDGTKIEVPEIDQSRLTMLITYLEQSLASGQDPVVVAQSARTHVPEDILAWIQANDTEACSGIDLFMTRVARLPGTSPLATLAGKNWLRKIGRALAGE